MTVGGARPDNETTDYARIGGGPAVSAVVDHFYELVLEDPQLAPYFAQTALPNLKRHQVQLISHLLGGPVEYEGKDLKRAHAGMNIGADDFGRVVSHLVVALTAAGVPEDVIARLGGTLGSVEPDIVGSPS